MLRSGGQSASCGVAGRFCISWELPALFRRLEVDTILDASCGDFTVFTGTDFMLIFKIGSS
jgi:hypothetical protein